MCGIIGYQGGAHGANSAVEVVVRALEKMAYRGYDSAGAAFWENGALKRVRVEGKIEVLKPLLMNNGYHASTLAVGHTRWATHGKPSEENAHPHASCDERIMVVHNGIIDNWRELREELEGEGHVFTSETDTEVIAHLIEKEYDGNFVRSVIKALRQLEGAFGVAVVHADHAEELIAARRGSPMVLGIGEGEYFVASDVLAFHEYTDRVVYLKDDDVVHIHRGSHTFTSLAGKIGIRTQEKVEWTTESAERGEHLHFTRKEIYEQPEAIANTLKSRLMVEEGNVRLGGLRDVASYLRGVERVYLVGCGSAAIAGEIGMWAFERFAKVRTEEMRSDVFTARELDLSFGRDVVFVISQSGETADTKIAMEEAMRQLSLEDAARNPKNITPVFGIVNVVGSTIYRETGAGVRLIVGPEIGVASTKAMTGQVAVQFMIAMMLGRSRGMSQPRGMEIARALAMVPEHMRAVLDRARDIERIAQKYANYENMYFLGAAYNESVAREGALKYKELTRVHAEAYSTREMKHGPIRLVREEFPSVVLVPRDAFYERTLSNIEELKARGGPVIAVACDDDKKIAGIADDVLWIPGAAGSGDDLLYVFPELVTLQLLAYSAALARRCDIDQPPGLAKSVTVG